MLLISCQSCDFKYDVQMSWDIADALTDTSFHQGRDAVNNEKKLLALAEEASLSGQIRRGEIHYGDPPCDNCMAGATMNCWDLAVLQFWTRDGRRAWERVPAMEIVLPDTTDREREES